MPGQLFLLQSGAALAHHLATSHYLATLLGGLLPGQSHCHLCNLTCSSQEVLEAQGHHGNFEVYLSCYISLSRPFHKSKSGFKTIQILSNPLPHQVLAVHLGVCHGQVLGIYSQGVSEDEAGQANTEETDNEGNIHDIEKVEDTGETGIILGYFEENEDIESKESNWDQGKNRVFEEELNEAEIEAEIVSVVIVKSIIDNVIEHMFVNTQIFHEDTGAFEEVAEIYKEGESMLQEKPFPREDLNMNTRLNSRAAGNTGSDFTCFDGEQNSDNSPSLGTQTKNLGITEVGPVTRSKASNRLKKSNAVEVTATETRNPKSECWEAKKKNSGVFSGCKTVNVTVIRKQECKEEKLEICRFDIRKKGEDAHIDIENGGFIDNCNAIMKSIIHEVIDDMFVGIEKATSLDSRSLKTKQEVSLRKREVLTRSQSAKISRTRKLRSKRKGR